MTEPEALALGYAVLAVAAAYVIALIVRRW
jgi:hypothetical protein